MALVKDAKEQTILPAMICKDHPNINARSVAVAMAFLGTGLFAINGDLAGQAAMELYESSQLDNLEAAIMAGLIAGEPSEVFLTRIKPHIDALISSNRGSRIIIPQISHRSGIDIVKDKNNNLSLINCFRRRSKLFLDRTGYVDQTGEFHEDNFPILKETIVPASTYNGLISSIMAAVISGNYIYNPVNLGPYHLPIVKGAKETSYRSTIVGIGLNPGDFEQTSREAQSAYERMAIRSMLVDVAIPLAINFILPVKEESYRQFIDYIEANPALINVANKLFVQPGCVIDNLESGNWSGAVDKALNALFGRGELRDTFLKTINDFLNERQSNSFNQTHIENTFEFTNNLIVTDFFDNAFETVLQLTNIAQSNRSDVTEFRISESSLENDFLSQTKDKAKCLREDGALFL